MYFLTIGIFVLNIYFSVGLGLYGFGNGYQYLMKELSSDSPLSDSRPEELWMEQPLDHFDDKENRTWKMRYFENLKLWKQGGPIYLFIGGEGTAHPAFLRTGILYELAEDTNGAMILSEHRYYGKSKPLNISNNADNLKYLSSRQALADMALLLKSYKVRPEYNNSKVVILGGSYAGNLAAWMKLLYPDLIDAAISSSAPVLAKKDFHEYLETVNDDYEQYGSPECMSRIRKIFRRYEKLFQSEKGIKELKEEEDICDESDMSVPENKQLFFLEKASQFMSNAQYGKPETIVSHCEQLLNATRIRSKIRQDEPLWNEKKECFDYNFDEMIKQMWHYDWFLPWLYQTCTEFGYYQSTNSDKQPFTKNVPPELFYKMCTKTFGEEFDEKSIDKSIDDTNNLYGGRRPNVTNVVFVNGDMDPWHRLGVLEDVSYDAPAKIIARASHCRDIFSNRSGDPDELIEARKYIKYLIKKWIGAGEYNIE